MARRTCSIAGLFRALLAASVGMLAATAALAGRTPTATELMDWAESQYSAFFPGRQSNQFTGPYVYRHYPQTGNYLGIAGSGVWILGPVAGSSSAPTFVGDLSNFASLVFPDSCVPGAYPNRGLTLIVPSTAGTAVDNLARDLAPALQSVLGQPITLSYVSGVTGVLATQALMRAPADGYTLLLGTSAYATMPAFFRSKPYQPLEAVEFLGMIAEEPLALLGKAKLVPKDVQALVEWVRASGKAVNFGTSTLASMSSLCQIQFINSTRSNPTWIPYKGSSPALTDLIAGNVDLLCDEIGTLGNVVDRYGLVRFGTTGPSRSAAADWAAVPTLHEQGLTGFNVMQWYGLHAPRGTPGAVLAHLSAALRLALADPATAKKITDRGLAVIEDARGGPLRHGSRVADEVARWNPLIEANGQFVD